MAKFVTVSVAVLESGDIWETETVPRGVAPSKKVTVPVGGKGGRVTDPMTVALRTTGWPKTLPLGVLEKMVVVVVGTLLTTWFKMGDVTEMKLTSPLYTAVMGCVPAISVEMPKVVVLVLAVLGVRVPVPRRVAPSKKETVPEGVPRIVGALTLTVKVTKLPKIEGLSEEVRLMRGVAWLTTWLRVEEVEVRKLVSLL